MSGLTLIAQNHAQWFGIDSLRDCVRFDIDSLRDCVRFENDSKVKLSCTWIDTG